MDECERVSHTTPSHGANGVVGVTKRHSKGHGVERFGTPVKSFSQIVRTRGKLN